MLGIADRSERRILKAEWTGEPYNFYCMQMECGHVMHATEENLRSPMLCILCLKEKMGHIETKIKELKDSPENV